MSLVKPPMSLSPVKSPNHYDSWSSTNRTFCISTYLLNTVFNQTLYTNTKVFYRYLNLFA